MIVVDSDIEHPGADAFDENDVVLMVFKRGWTPTAYRPWSTVVQGGK